MSDTILSAKFMPGKHAGFMNRIDNPPSMIFTRFNTTIIDTKVSTKFESSFNDVTAITHIFKHTVTDPKVWFYFACFFKITLKGDSPTRFTAYVKTSALD